MVIQVASLGVLIFNTAIIARWLGPEGKGIQQLAFMIPGMLALFMSGGIGVANVYYAGTGRLDIGTLTSNSLAFTLMAFPIGLAILVGGIISGWVSKILPGVPIWAILLVLAAFPVELLLSQFNAILLGDQQIITINLINLGRSIVGVLFTLILVVGMNLNLLGAILAPLIAGLGTLIVTGNYVHRSGGVFIPRWNAKVMRTTLSFGLRGYVANLLQYFNYRLDVFLVNFFLGPAGVGIYGASVRLAELLWQLPNAVGYVIFPKAAATNVEVMNTFTPRVLKITLLLTALGAAGLVLTGKLLIEVIYSSSFLSAYLPMLMLLPGVILMGGAKILLNEISGRGYPQYYSITSGIALIATVMLDFLLIPRYGVIGASVASSIAYTTIFVFSVGFYLIVRKSSISVKNTNV